MTMPQSTPDDPNEPFAPRTSQLIGRQIYIDSIHAALADTSGRSHVLYFVGHGGIGKTRLLEEVGMFQKTWTDTPFRWTDIIDLYHADYHSPGGLRQAIADGLDPEKQYFQQYRSLREIYEQKRKEG